MQARAIRRIIDRGEPAVVKAFFGSGKTQACIDAARYSSRVVVVAEPLRRLRDQVASRIKRRGAVVLKAHEEVCDDLARLARGGGRHNYYIALSKHLKSGSCRYRDYFRRTVLDGLVEGHIVTTHSIAPVASLVARAFGYDANVVVDEAESYLVSASQAISRGLYELLASDRFIRQKIRNIYEVFGAEAYIRDQIVIESLRSVMMSATPPPSIFSIAPRYVSKIEYVDLGGYDRHGDSIYIFSRIVGSENIEFYRSAVRDLCSRAVRLYGVCAVSSRNLHVTKALRIELERAGYKVSADDLDSEPSDDADVYIITVGGRFYRGVSIYSSRIGSGDFPFIIGLYQHTIPLHPHKLFHDLWGVEFRAYARELAYALNLQALYRFNRSGREHTMVLLDSRFLDAFSLYYPQALSLSRVFDRFGSVEEIQL